MQTIELLKKAKDLITDPDHWVQRRFGVTKEGKIVQAINLHKADKFCAVGALYGALGESCRGDGSLEVVQDAKNELHLDLSRHEEEKYQQFTLTGFNDQTSHPEVLALYDATIERLENG